MAAFSSYSWPGNIRELQNLVARAMILAQDGVLPNPLPASALPIRRPTFNRGDVQKPRASCANDDPRIRTRAYTLYAASDALENRRTKRGSRKAGFEADNADVPAEEAWNRTAIATRCSAGRLNAA